MNGPTDTPVSAFICFYLFLINPGGCQSLPVTCSSLHSAARWSRVDTNEQLSEGQNNTSHYSLFVSFLFIEIFPSNFFQQYRSVRVLKVNLHQPEPLWSCDYETARQSHDEGHFRRHLVLFINKYYNCKPSPVVVRFSNLLCETPGSTASWLVNVRPKLLCHFLLCWAH